MKKTPLLNSQLSAIIAQMGHLDELTIGDAGLPIPNDPERIDLAITPGLPALLPSLAAILSELRVESVIIAKECQAVSPDFYAQLLALIGAQDNSIAVTYLSHTDFKAQTAHSRAVVRTGECTPYANIILKSGVAF
ncbi:D-ribose pyranase [Reinekea sp.]|jgi:D-ribose pyranase|uniref:D-ribose pyranase n=1 Tax=Reinekea sp. TaxID=1970455 RepID=UPI002A836781|nr:D-ribose pyranase [Reinekea sp.]